MQVRTINPFQEHQKFKQWFIWLPLLSLLFLPIVVMLWKGTVDAGLIIMLLITTGIVTLFYFIKLTTIYNSDSVIINFSPLTGERIILWKDVVKVHIGKYKFVGYGLRYGKQNTTYYNISGNIGLTLVLKSGETVVVGTKSPQELSNFLNNLEIAR